MAEGRGKADRALRFSEGIFVTRSDEVCEHKPVSERAAGVVSEALAPIVVVPLVIVIVALRSTHGLGRGLGLAATAIAFSAGLPYVVLTMGIRRGRFGDRHVRARHQRPALLAFTLASVISGWAVLHSLDAPADLIALVGAMVAGMAVTLVVSMWWKISIHTSCVAGAIGASALLVSSTAWFFLPIAALVGWSRLVLRHHTLAQVTAGAGAGLLVSTSVLALLR